MKRHLLFIIASLVNFNPAFAQKDAKTDPRFERFMDKVANTKGVTEIPKQVSPSANRFYKSYEDFLNNNPVPGILLSKDRTEVLGKASYGVDRNGTIEKTSVEELSEQFWGFCNQYGVLYRLTEKDAFLVIIAGNITQYVRAGQCSGTLNKDSTFTLLFGASGQGGYLDYASEGVNGEIVDLDANLKNGKSKELEQLMADHPEIYQRLLADEDQEQYVKDKYRKRENLTFKLQHYIREYNKL